MEKNSIDDTTISSGTIRLTEWDNSQALDLTNKSDKNNIDNINIKIEKEKDQECAEFVPVPYFVINTEHGSLQEHINTDVGHNDGQYINPTTTKELVSFNDQNIRENTTVKKISFDQVTRPNSTIKQISYDDQERTLNTTVEQVSFLDNPQIKTEIKYESYSNDDALLPQHLEADMELITSPSDVGHKPSKSCSLCGKDFKSNSKLLRHSRTHTGEQSFKCIICSRPFMDDILLDIHMGVHKSGELKVITDISSSSVQQNEEKAVLDNIIVLDTSLSSVQQKNEKAWILDNIIIQSDDKQQFKCRLCKKSFILEVNVLKHMKSHGDPKPERPFKCEVCQKAFARDSHLREHLTIHTGEKPYNCLFCPKSFRHASDLTRHHKTHAGLKPHKCAVCEKSFLETSKLKIHMRIHSGEKPYNCSMCPKSFTQISHLNEHIRTHTGEKPFKCPVCHSVFRYASVLNQHKKTHMGNPPYQCNVCKKQFKHEGHYKTHIKVHTGKITPEEVVTNIVPESEDCA